MSRSTVLLEEYILSKVENGEEIDEELLESVNGPRNISFFDWPNNDLAIAVDNWDYPRCAYVMSNNEAIAKISIPTSNVQSLNILDGYLSNSEEHKAIEILNSKVGGIPCWESIWYCLEPRSTFTSSL